jgi:hypothetical protein
MDAREAYITAKGLGVETVVAGGLFLPAVYSLDDLWHAIVSNFFEAADPRAFTASEEEVREALGVKDQYE